MDLRIDHVTVAGYPLEELERGVASVGLTPDYGGVHSNDVTHMSQLGFPDRSYVEFISTLEPDDESPWWNRHIHANAGPCAWAVRVDDVLAVARDFARRGIPVAGPDTHSRERADGGHVEFALAFLGGGEPGIEFPFLIADRTPHERRIEPSTSTVGTGLWGVAEVVLGVPDVGATIDRFRHAFDTGQPDEESHPEFGAVTYPLPDLPVSLAMPVGESWLADRVHKYGVCPCAYLLGTEDLDAVADRFPLEEEGDPWIGRRVAWFGEGVLPAGRLGVLERPA